GPGSDGGVDAGAHDTGPLRDAGDAGGDGGSIACVTDLDCTDHVFCNGVERCDRTASGADPVTGCAPATTANPCLASQTCNEDMDRCESECTTHPDADGDGVNAVACGGTDCDDAHAAVHPGAAEVCD